MRGTRFCGLNRRRRDSAVAIYLLHVKTVLRGAGRSVVAAAAYRAAETIADERLGVVWDFTRKYGVLHSEIVASRRCSRMGQGPRRAVECGRTRRG
jgi:hypothetical protein